MPIKPRKDESKNDFIPRCVGVEVGAGREQAQAVAICYDIWKRHKRRKKDTDEGLIS